MLKKERKGLIESAQLKPQNREKERVTIRGTPNKGDK